jgi:hypothetical protein
MTRTFGQKVELVNQVIIDTSAAAAVVGMSVLTGWLCLCCFVK